MEYIDTPIHDQMAQSPECDFLMADEDKNKYINYVKNYVDSFDPEDISYDSYCCHVSLFAAYCFAGDTSLALTTLTKLEQFDVQDYDRHLEHITACLADLGEFALARQYARRIVDMVSTRFPPPQKALYLIPVYRNWMRIICDEDPSDSEIPVLMDTISYLTCCQYLMVGLGTSQSFDILMPLNLVPASGIVILQSMWSYMKCDEAFGGNNYQDELVKIEAWLAQLSEPA